MRKKLHTYCIFANILHFLGNISKFCGILYINLINGAFHGNINLRRIFEILKHTHITRLHIYTNVFIWLN